MINTSKTKNYNHTIRACCIAYIIHATINNFAPLLFLTFQSVYQIDIRRIALLVGVNFGVQLLTSLFGANFADKIGYRPMIIAGHIFAALGLIGLSVLPEILPSAYVGLLISVILHGIGGGTMEVLVSPIVEACPTDPNKKSAMMSLLHSFYCWGQVTVIVLSTLFFVAFGIEYWHILAIIWAVIPVLNAIYFSRVPITQLGTGDTKSMSMRDLISTKLFWLLIVIMICAGASELAMGQWASFFAEDSLGISKTLGDLLGPGMFAVLMGISRVFYSKFSDKINLQKFIIASGCLCIITYLIAAFSPIPIIALIASALTGLSVGIMWPGMLSIAAAKCPRGGTALFALLAVGGTIGCSVGPMTVGMIAGTAEGGIRAGLAFGTIFPVVLVIGVVLLIKGGQRWFKQM